MVRQVIATVMIGVLMISAVLYISLQIDRSRLLMGLLVAVAAAVGAAVNASNLKKGLPKMSPGSWVWFFLWKIMVAIVFATVLYFVFVGEFLYVDIFPHFVQSENKVTTVLDFFVTVDPESYQDVAKIVVWSFVAGFCERFVPNLVAGFVSRAGRASGQSAA